MKKTTLAGVLLAACASPVLHAAPVPDNEALQALYAADQSERKADKIDWPALTRRDMERRQQVKAMLAAGSVRTAHDFFNAAMVFQHGQATEDHSLAFSLATISRTLDPDNGEAKWLSAASFDRYLVSHNMPQWYGTQSMIPRGSMTETLRPVDPNAVTDEERVALNVPRLQEKLAEIAERNKTRQAK